MLPSTFSYFTKKNNKKGLSKFIKKEDLNKENDNKKSLLKNNKIVIGVYLCVYKYTIGIFFFKISFYDL